LGRRKRVGKRKRGRTRKRRATLESRPKRAARTHSAAERGRVRCGLVILSLIRPFGRGHVVFWRGIQLRFDQTEPAFENAARQGRGSLVSRKQVGDVEESVAACRWYYFVHVDSFQLLEHLKHIA
jgi:hypothetical protein